jgi:PAS domain S-box-containing protein
MADNNDIPAADQNLSLRQIIDSSPALLHTARPDGYLDFFNQTWLNFAGRPLEKLLGWGWTSCIHPEDVEAFVQKMLGAFAKEKPFQETSRVRRADGVYRWMLHLKVPIFDRDGNLIKWNGSSVDIDDQKRADETLRKNERELGTLIDIIPAYVGTALPDGSVDFISQRWLDYSGQTRKEAMGRGWAATVHPDDVEESLAHMEAGLLAGESVDQEMRCRRADGVYRWFLHRSLPLRDDDGKIVKWYGIFFDIHSLKETESALQMREQELLGIIETIPSMFWSTSPDGEVTHLNQRVLKYSGLSHKDFLNLGWKCFVHPDDLEDTAKAFFRAIQTGEPYSATHRLRRRDGEYRWHHASGMPLRDCGGRIIQWYGLSIDIDEGKRAEDHLHDTRIKLAKTSRLATVAELAGSIAHELNQPLMSILANAQAAKRWLNANPPNVVEVNSSIERVIRDAQAADETMQHIRALFKKQSFDKKDICIPDILREVVRIVQEDPQKCDVPIECHFEDTLPLIFIDRIQIQQVFINLIVNAIEALEGQQANRLVELRAAADENEMLIQVVDSGPGVEDTDRIFDSFVTTKKKGMGIGLAMSRSIVEAHGGRLWAENNRTGGAIFNVALPLFRVNSTTV